MRYKNLFSFGVRMQFLAPNGCKVVIFAIFKHKKEKVRKSLVYSKIYVPLQPQIRKVADCVIG